MSKFLNDLVSARTLVCLFTLALVGSLALQHLGGWLPCALCILQRLAVAALVVSYLVQAMTTGLARTAAGLLGYAASIGGMAAAGYQLKVLYTPKSQCSPGIAKAVDDLAAALPGSDWFLEPKIACGMGNDYLLGLPLPAVALALFALPLTLACWKAFPRR